MPAFGGRGHVIGNPFDLVYARLRRAGARYRKPFKLLTTKQLNQSTNHEHTPQRSPFDLYRRESPAPLLRYNTKNPDICSGGGGGVSADITRNLNAAVSPTERLGGAKKLKPPPSILRIKRGNLLREKP
jgi:hypothetical protein